MRQHEAVIQAMKSNGGYATLGQLYSTAPRIAGSSWGTETPDASIRRIVQKRPEFFRIKPGLWALKSEKAEVLKRLAGTTPTQKQELNHSYYQGLIVQLGNYKNFETFIPNQDKNKEFLPQETLGSISTLGKFHEFTYKHIIRRGRTVDVTWFNERKLPNSFFEVEDSTDFYNSLLKFLEFQDFLVDFHIVADSIKRKHFDRKLAYSAFKPIRQRVKFLSYEKLADWYSTTAASVRTEESLYI